MAKKKAVKDILQDKKISRTPTRVPKSIHPKGWEPYVEITGNTAKAVSQPTAEINPDEVELTKGFNLDPEEWEVVGEINCRRWERNEGEWLHYYKCNYRRRTSVDREIKELTKEVLKRKPPAKSKKKPSYDNSAFILCIADMQAGSGEGGGAQGLVDRFVDAVDRKVDHIKDLHKIGIKPSKCVIASLADLVEGICGFYASQSFSIDLNARDQQKLVVSLLHYAVESMLPLFDEITVTGIPGNHGQYRQNGKAITDDGDNMDLLVLDNLAFSYALNPDVYGKVEFIIPKDQVSFGFNVANTTIGLNHGHIGGSGANPELKILNWWKGQLLGRTDSGVAEADILVTGHFHHFRTATVGSRTWFQCPALDGGSKWFRDATGNDAPAGLLSFVVQDGGWSNLDITTCVKTDPDD